MADVASPKQQQDGAGAVAAPPAITSTAIIEESAPAVTVTTDAASPHAATTQVARGRKRQQAQQQQSSVASSSSATGSFSPGGHYADPMSPIASTPLKRQRVSTAEKPAKPTSQPSTSSSVRKKKSQVEDSSKGSDKFFSPRKLVSEYDVEDKKTDAMRSKVGSTISSNNASATKSNEHSDAEVQNDDDPNGVMFSPTLKPPRAAKTSSNPSPSNVHTKLEASFLSSSSTCSEKNDDEDEETATTTIGGCEAEEEEEAYTYTVGSESGSEVSVTEQEFNPFYFMKTLPKYEHVVIGPRSVALPAKSRHAPKISLVLDLDETLVHCSVDDVENPHLQFPVNFNGVEYTVKVKKRPHMEYFLKRVSQLFEVVVFTASHRAYAETLLNLIDPHRNLIKYRLYREDCLDVYGNYLKDLNVLGRHLSKVLLVDNSPHAFGYQVSNGIPIETWYDDEGDDELLNLLPFLESLVDVDDVRPIVEKQFQIQKLIDATPDELI